MARDSSPEWLRNPDPLGIGLRMRAQQRRWEIDPYGIGTTASMGPLIDPAWDAFKQSLYENDVNEIGQAGSVFGSLPSTIDPSDRRQVGIETTAGSRGSGIRGLDASPFIGNTQDAVGRPENTGASRRAPKKRQRPSIGSLLG